MSLYRTWRPRTFADLVGQDAVVRTLTSALQTGKIAHAYLFSGPRGSGKTSAAKIMARCLDCVHGPTATPDNTCDFCRAMLDGTALDVLEIDAASNRGIDEIRALRDAVKFAPSSMRYKVYIIDEAHMLTKEGANAFLKTLEEPPEHAVFILATTEPERLPVTILSRCQRYAFRRIAIPVMIERMREIADAEKIEIDDAALAAIAYRADGGLRDALTMLEQAAAFATGPIDIATLDDAFGATGRNYARGLLDAALARDASAALRSVEDASDAGADMQVLMRALIAEFRNLLVARVDPQLLVRDLAPDDAAAAADRAKDVPQATIVRALRLLSDAASLARTSGNARLELESALLRFVLAGEDPTLDALSARVAALEDGGGAHPARQVSALAPEPMHASAAPKARSRAAEAPAPPEPAPAPKPTPAPKTEVKAKAPEPEAVAEPVAETPEPPAAPAPTKSSGEAPTLQKVRAAWQNIRGKAESEKPSLRGPLSGAMLDSVNGNALVLRLRTGLDAEVVKDNAQLIERAISDVLGAPLHVTCKIDDSRGAGARGKSGAPAPDVPATAAESFQEPDDDPDMLFQYANERIQER